MKFQLLLPLGDWPAFRVFLVFLEVATIRGPFALVYPVHPLPTCDADRCLKSRALN